MYHHGRLSKPKKGGNVHISLRAIQQYLMHGHYPAGSTTMDKRSIRKRAEGFKIDDGDQLYYIVKPKRLDDEPPDPDPGANRLNYRKAVFTLREQLTLAANLHINDKGIHMGTDRTLNILTAKYYWVGMSATVRKVIRSCSACVSNRPFSAYTQVSSSIIDPSMQGESQANLSSNATVTATVAEIDDTNELPCIVKAEMIEIPQDDPGLDFDPNMIVMRPSEFISTSEMLRAQHFWERVEIIVMELPSSTKKKKSYILLVVDSFSKWPEAIKMDSVNEKKISQFIIQLISRYGVMEQLVLLENETLQEVGYSVHSSLVENLSTFSISVTTERFNSYDESLMRICCGLEQFAQRYPEDWFDIIDICLMPLRMSVSSSADYSPAYLLMKRDPKFPNCVLPMRDSPKRELMLAQVQLHEASDKMMREYMDCSVKDIKRVLSPSNPMSSPVTDLTDNGQTIGIRRSSRKSKKFHRLAGFDDSNPNLTGNGTEELSRSNVNVDSSVLEFLGESSIGLMKKRKMVETLKENHDVDESPLKKGNQKDGNRQSEEINKDEDEILEKVTVDMFYLIMKRFLESGAYPSNSSQSVKQAIKNSCRGHTLNDDKLVYLHKRGEKTVPMALRERCEILNEIHISEGEHLPKSKMLDELEHRLLFWKEMPNDVDAFVKACADCKHGTVRRKSTKLKKWRKDDLGEEEGFSDAETKEGEDVGKASYDDLIKYLSDDIYPSTLTRAELVIFKKKAKNFKLVRKELQYCPVSMSKASSRKVLLAKAERQSAVRKAHGGNHLMKSGTITELRKKYFWHGMGHDVERFIESCCQPETEKDKDTTDESVSDRVKQFQGFLQGKEMPSVEPESIDKLFPQPVFAEERDPAPDSSPKHKETPDDSSVCNIVISLDERTGILQDGNSSLPSECPNMTENGEDKGDMPMIVPDKTVLETKEISSDFGIDLKLNHDDVNNEMEGIDADRDKDWKPIKEIEEIQQERAQIIYNPSIVLMQERTKVSKKKGIKIRCEHCHIIVRGENNYKEHKYKHTGIKPFQCHQCPKMFTSIKGMRMHMRKHTGHRPYLCNICGRGFPRSASLRYHIKTHDKVNPIPFICDVCERKFTTAHRLEKHKRFKHPDEAPVFKCDQCGKQFTAKRSLKRHQEAHQGIRRYECQHCKRSFFRKEYLNYHLESHYKDGPSPGPLSAKRRFKKRALMQQQAGAKENVVSLVSIDRPSGQQDVYSQLVEVANDGWEEVEHPTQEGQTLAPVINIDGSIQIGDIAGTNESGATVVMVEEQSTNGGEVQVHHFIVPPSHVQQRQPQQEKQEPQEIQHQQEQPQHHQIEFQSAPPHQQQTAIKQAVITNSSGGEEQPEMIEVTLSNGQKTTLTLAGTNNIQVGDSNQETVQYHVECLPGETLTEADFQAIQMLAQASVLQQQQ